MLTDLYHKLCQAVPIGKEALYGLPIVQGEPQWIAIDENAYPTLLLPARTDDHRPDIMLRAVDVLFSRNCLVETEGEKVNAGCYSLIRLKENDSDIVRLFLKILEERFCGNNSPKCNSEIAMNIQEVAAIFSRVENKTRDLVGLWGELYVIVCSANIVSAVQCWCTQKTSKFDFVTQNFVLDVKTNRSSIPKHRFSLEQLRPPKRISAFIGSICVAEVQSGQTVGIMMDQILEHINDRSLRSSFLGQCLAKGGADVYRSEMTLKPYPDTNGLVFYKALDIPVPTINEHDPVDHVRFDVDLSSIKSLSLEDSQNVLRFL